MSSQSDLDDYRNDYSNPRSSASYYARDRNEDRYGDRYGDRYTNRFGDRYGEERGSDRDRDFFGSDRSQVPTGYSRVDRSSYRSDWDDDRYSTRTDEPYGSTYYSTYGSKSYDEGRFDSSTEGPYYGRGPKNYRRSDERIYEDVCMRLARHGRVDASDVEVDVDNGTVTLSGSIRDKWMKRMAEDVVEDTPGVRSVENKLDVEDREESSRFTDTDRDKDRSVDTEKDQVVSGIFKNRDAASLAVEKLVEAGFPRTDISLLMSESTRGREFGVVPQTKAPEGAATGAALGGVVGGLIAGLAAVGTIALPGIGLVAAGPLLAALAGIGAGGAAGGLLGALVGAGIPEREAKFYAEAIKAGGILVGVTCVDDRVDDARRILNESGGESITSSSR